MNSTEALAFIGLSSGATAQQISDRYDEVLFEQCQEALRSFFVRPVLEKNREKLQRHNQAFEAFVHEEIRLIPHLHLPECEEAVLFLETWEKAMTECKFYLANAPSFDVLITAISQSIDALNWYSTHFLRFWPEVDETLNVPSREGLDSGPVLRALKSGELSSDLFLLVKKESTRLHKLEQLIRSAGSR